MKFAKTELTRFAKDCVKGTKIFQDAICISEEISHDEIGRIISNGLEDDNLILEISKRYAKYAKDDTSPDVDTGEVQSFCKVISKITDCCDKNNWFETD